MKANSTNNFKEENKMKNLEGKELFGISFGKGNTMEGTWKDYFEVIEDYDDQELLLKFKETFKNDFFDNGNEIEYNFYLEVYNGNVYGEEAGVWFHIYLVPKLQYIHKSHYEKLYKEYNGTPNDEWLERDILQETQCPLLVNEQIDIDLNEDWYPPEMEELLEIATCVFPFINRTIGFYMDRHINAIGSTNWDCLESILDGSNWTSKALNRWKKQ